MFGFCRWDIVALIVLICVIIIFMVQQKKHKSKVHKILKDENNN